MPEQVFRSAEQVALKQGRRLILSLRPGLRFVPAVLVLIAFGALIAHGPVPQDPAYHQFADHRSWLGVANALDVLSNAGFAIIGGYGLYRLWPRMGESVPGWPGFALFLAALVLTAFGSAFYHLAPDDHRLIWDRLPIALACAGLLAGVRTKVRPNVNAIRVTGVLAFVAAASVFWWYATEQVGAGDLRPYLLLQASPLVLIPLWQAIYRAPRADRVGFGVAIALYVGAKVAELLDHQLFASTHWISGHTLKHLLAALAAAVVVGTLVRGERAVNRQ